MKVSLKYKTVTVTGTPKTSRVSTCRTAATHIPPNARVTGPSVFEGRIERAVRRAVLDGREVFDSGIEQ